MGTPPKAPPPKPKDEVRDRSTSIRFTASERERIDAVSEAAGYGPSEWMHAAVIGALRAAEAEGASKKRRKAGGT
jgi:hypothetical protein